ncbi:amino acid adenylation domain-containing protein, partial [Janthinobacterium sp. PSPC1-1]|uniref:amino acid adenylation domain-containing protein n=1 Tax=Janthinobacterium sp. PSPC1-1 TaxID=2804581 RepID=UPI003CEE3573
IHELFEAQVARTPAQVALVYGDEQLTYAQLNARANQLAHALRARGVRHESIVAICLERSPELILSLLAVLKAGGAYLPLDPGMPAERLAGILANASPVLLIAGADAAVLAGAIPVLLIDHADALVAEYSEKNLDIAEVSGRSLAYLMHTSGSTGEPRGVMVEHRNVLRLVINVAYAPVGESDCVAHCANPAFDASTWEIWSALLNGARLLLIDHATVMDAASLNRTLSRGGVTAMWLTAGLFNACAEQLEEAFGQLTYLLVGGDVLDPGRIALVLGNAKRPRHILNGYGPTETTTFATTFQIDHVDGSAIPIGRPIANTSVYILDREGQPSPIGVEGEIYIGGNGVARGYLNCPELTKKHFIPDPFSTAKGAHLYRSGDLGKVRADGNIEFIGRNDGQVKLRGFRIELGEIEHQLAQHAQVGAAVVLARSDDGQEKR